MNFKIFANWKMQLDGKSTKDLMKVTSFCAQRLSNNADVVVFPSMLHTPIVQGVEYVSWGVQDVSQHGYGAYTGQVCAQDVVEAGGSYAILGHVEVRKSSGDDDDVVIRKALACYALSLTPIVCFGASNEPQKQAEYLIEEIRKERPDQPIVLAFEPTASVGTGQAFSLEGVCALMYAVRQHTNVAFVYGGSVHAENLESYWRAGVDGVLVGGASQHAEKWRALLQVVESLRANDLRDTLPEME